MGRRVVFSPGRCDAAGPHGAMRVRGVKTGSGQPGTGEGGGVAMRRVCLMKDNSVLLPLQFLLTFSILRNTSPKEEA